MKNGFEEMFVWLQDQQLTYEQLRLLHEELKLIESFLVSNNMPLKYYNDCMKAFNFYMLAKYCDY